MHYYLSWGQLALILTAALLIYYLVLFSTSYRDEISRLLAKKPGEPVPNVDDGVMGIVKMDDAEMSLASSHELDFAPEDGDNKTLLLGGLADFMEDLKILVRVTTEENDTKSGFLLGFRSIAERYAQVTDGVFNASIVSYLLYADLPFNLAAEELEEIMNNLIND